VKVLHIITGLETGGAEMMLYKLLAANNNSSQKFEVLSLMELGRIGRQIELLNVPLYTLSLNRQRPFSFRACLKCIHLVNKIRPDVIQGWMYHGNIVSTFVSFVLRLRFYKVKTIWNIRHSLYEINREKFLTRLLIRVSKYFSIFPNVIIYNSIVSSKQHEKLGFFSKNNNVIPNGFDIKLFHPSKSTYAEFRNQLKVSADTLLIGNFARYHPMKDHRTLFLAVREVVKLNKNICFVLAGSNITIDNIELINLIEDLKISQNVKLLGECSNMHEIFPALDLLVTSSAWGEGFPNVIGEALACGVPCVVTDVGDSALVVDRFGKVVNHGDYKSLSNEIINMLQLLPNEIEILGKEARKFIRSKYSIDTILDLYIKIYESQ
jgi:glycosyltransferase involved in cell wall biosynthesis